MIVKMLEAKAAMTKLYHLMIDIVSEAEGAYCASGKLEDRMRLAGMMQSRAALIESMGHFAEAGGAEIVQPAKAPTGETLNANGKAL